MSIVALEITSDANRLALKCKPMTDAAALPSDLVSPES